MKTRTHPTLIITLLSLLASVAFAGSATWNLNPATNDWNTAANWTPATVPNGVSDIATFDISNTTAVSLSASVQASIVFDSGASPYTITVPTDQVLTLNGAGITNNSGIVQEFVVDKGSGAGGVIQFNSGTAGDLVHFEILGIDHGITPSSRIDFLNFSNAGTASFDVEPSEIRNTDAGHLNFHNFSSAGSATIRLHANSTAPGIPADLSFYDSASAGSATINVDGGKVRNDVGSIIFFNTSSKAGSSVITINGAEVSGALSGVVQFNTSASPEGATFMAKEGVGAGGTIRFFNSATTSSTSKMMLFGNGNLDVSGLGANAFGLTIGSLEGNGIIFLGSKNLSVGSNNLNTSYSGVIQDGGFNGGIGGSVTKVGSGTLTLRGASSYTGLTTVNSGALVLANHTGSATGAGAVKVNGGRLGGNGIVMGSLTIGTGSGSGAALVPRLGLPGTSIILTVGGALTFNADATYNESFNSTQGTADGVIANGVTITGARLLLKDRRTTTLPAGTVFTLISNMATTPISGTFSNLPDGSTITVGNNTYLVSYEGGDGNDLTLTVQ
jgi:autotransporter-associated beta strand protein